MTVIYHICQNAAWQAALATGDYRAQSLTTEGFIHCSTREQVLAVANRLFNSQVGLVLLKIDEAAIKPSVRYENLEGGDNLFPHIYGPLNLSAVLSVASFTPELGGTFVFPKDDSWQLPSLASIRS